MTIPARIRLVLLASMLLVTPGATPSIAQQLGADGAPNPTASILKERALLQQKPRLEGRIDIPDPLASVLVQPAGRTWNYLHEVTWRWLGVVVILGMVAALAVAYLFGVRLRISAGRSGKKVPRFTAFERFAHWLTASSFVVLGLTGLNITFGKVVLLPLVGAAAFSDFSQAMKYVHDFTSFAFVVGLVLIGAMWIKDNIPRRVDVDWLKQGGGFIKSKHAAAGRFNAGEKLVFWFALGGGLAVAVSGYLLLFPFYGTNIAGMQVAQLVHAAIAFLFVALILAHIYIGTIGMEGAFEAMGTGEVDRNWAKEHHDLWFAEQTAKTQQDGSSEQPPVSAAE